MVVRSTWASCRRQVPTAELLEVSRGLALPASLKSLQQRIDNAHMPKGAKEIDGHFEDSVNRVRHLHSLVLGEWNLPDMSQDQTLRAPRADRTSEPTPRVNPLR